MADVQTDPRTVFRNGVERVRELLRQARRSEETGEVEHLMTQCVETLCAISPLAGEDPDTDLPDVLAKMGLGLAREGRLSMWATLLTRFSAEASARREINAIRVAAQTVDHAASPPSLEEIFQRFQQPAPPRVDALVELLRVLPATAITMATKYAILSVPEFLLEPVREFCRASSEHHLDGLLELAADPDPAVARFALGTVDGANDDRVRQVAGVCLRHDDVEVRIAAIRLLGQNVSDGGTKLLLERHDRRFKTPMPVPEEIMLFAALVATGRHDALARVEERLVSAPPTLSSRLLSLVRTTPDDAVAAALIHELAISSSAQAHDLLLRGTHSANPAVARACRDQIVPKQAVPKA